MTHMPAQIVCVDSEREISDLFVQVNKFGRKAPTPNEVFVHEVLSADTEAVKTASNLKKCRLRVSLGTGEMGSVVGDLNGPEVKVEGFKAAIKHNDLPSVELSSKIIQSQWPDDKKIHIELMDAIAMICKNTSLVFTKNHKEWFIKFLSNCQSVTRKQIKLASKYKSLGGNVVNHGAKCIAYALLDDFREFLDDHGHVKIKSSGKYYRKFQDNLKRQIRDKNKD
jgi:hypothetical protein